MVRHLSIEAQPTEPPVGKVEVNLGTATCCGGGPVLELKRTLARPSVFRMSGSRLSPPTEDFGPESHARADRPTGLDDEQTRIVALMG